MSAKNFALLLVVAYLCAWIFIPAQAQNDFACFQSWATFIRSNGLSHAYELPAVDYNPLFLELLWLFGRVQGPAETLNTSFFTFKVFVLLFDFAAVVAAAYLLRRNGRNIALACLLLFNPAHFYNTVFWGQVDAIFSLFVLLSIVLATRKRVVASFVCLELAINFKLIAVVFIPIVVLLNLPAVLDNRRVLLRALPLLLVIQVAILLPFLDRHGLAAVAAANAKQLKSSSATSPSGFNFWYVVFGERTYEVPASAAFLHVSYRVWGLVMFAIAAAATLLPLFRTTILRKQPLDDAYVLLSSAVYWLAFYCLTTGMHERYSHPAILMFGIYAVLSGNYTAYVLASIAYFLNLESGYRFFQVATHDTRIFKGPFVGALFCAVLIAGVVEIHRRARSARRLAEL